MAHFQENMSARSAPLGRELLNQIESVSPSSSTSLWSLGGAGYVIKAADQIVYIDPYLIEPDSSKTFHRAIPVPFPPEIVRRASAIMSTHEHEDHCDETTLKAFLNNTDADFIGPVASAKKAISWGFPSDRVVTLSPGYTHRLSDQVRILCFESKDPYAESPVTYLLETSGGNVYHSGDTSYFEVFAHVGKKHRIDVALLNFGKQIPTPEKPYYMNAKNVAAAARDLGARTLVPIHWDIWLEARDDPESIRPELGRISPSTRMVILNVGDKLEL